MTTDSLPTLSIRGLPPDLGKKIAEAIPGLRWRSQGLHIPYNAAGYLKLVLDGTGLRLTEQWKPAAPRLYTWPEIEKQLRDAGHLRPFVYDFLLPLQREAITFGWSLPGFHLWHPMGAGKTLSSLVWLSTAATTPRLIVTRAPSRIQFAREVMRFTDFKPYVVLPDSERRRPRKGLEASLFEIRMRSYEHTLTSYLDATPHNAVVITAWDTLEVVAAVFKTRTLGAVVFDEIHRGKSSKRWSSRVLSELPDDLLEASTLRNRQATEAQQLGGFITEDDDGTRTMILPQENVSTYAARLARRADRRLGATGTPVKDRRRDLASQLDLIEPGQWGSMTAWLDRYADRKPGVYAGYDTTGASNSAELAARLARVVHHVDSSVSRAQLPAKRRESRYVPVGQQDKASGFTQAQRAETVKRGAMAVLEMELMRAAATKRTYSLNLIKELVENNGKVVVFTGRRADAEALGAEINKKLKVTSWWAHGATSATQRQGIVDDYMSHPGPCVLVATGQSFGESLNLQDTDAALFVMLPWTPGDLAQWEGRFARFGQKRPVTIYFLIAEDSADEHVASVLIDKIASVEAVANDSDYAGTRSALGGIDNEEAVLDSILALLQGSSYDDEDA